MTAEAAPNVETLSAQIDGIARMCDVLSEQRDRARDIAVALEQENAELQREIATLRGKVAAFGSICAECRQHGHDVAIVFVPRSGFGNTGEWRHTVTPPTAPGHMPRPHVFITDARDEPRGAGPDAFLGC